MPARYEYIVDEGNRKINTRQAFLLIANNPLYTKKDALKLCKNVEFKPSEVIKRRRVYYTGWERLA